MGTIDISNTSYASVEIQTNKTKPISQKKNDNIFATTARKIGMESFAEFLSDDWSANVARKAGFDNFANWLDNKSNEGNALNDGFFSNLAREAIKHPVVTLATIATTIFLGKKLVNIFKKAPDSKQVLEIAKNTTTNKTTATAAATTTTSTTIVAAQKQNLTPAQIREIIDNGLAYEQKIKFSNLEIFKDVAPNAQKRILSHFGYPYHQERLLSFASGSTPGLLEKPFLDDIFDVLRSNSIKVIEAFDKEAGTLILNTDAAQKIIKANKSLFTQRLGLAETASVDEIFTLISKSFGSPLADAKKYSDLKVLLTGGIKKNATFSQILQDIANAEKHKQFNVGYVSFYRKSASGLEGFKKALIENLNSSQSSYSSMPKSFKEEVLKMIDSITLQEYSRRLEDPMKFFQDCTYNLQKQESMQKLALKLEKARKTGATINLL